MKRQLLLQEANNLLLQADITRRETELLRYKQVAKKNPSLKRWNTYGGMEGRVVSDPSLLFWNFYLILVYNFNLLIQLWFLCFCMYITIFIE